MFFGKIKIKIGENYNIFLTKLYNFSVEACQARLPEADVGPTGRVPRLPGYWRSAHAVANRKHQRGFTRAGIGSLRRSRPIGNGNAVP